MADASEHGMLLNVGCQGHGGWGLRPAVQPAAGLPAHGIMAEELLLVSGFGARRRAAALSRAGADGPSWPSPNHREAPHKSEDYLERMARFGIEARFKIEETARRPGCVWLDVRSEADAEAEAAPVPAVRWPIADTTMQETAARLLPSKHTPVLVFCSTGERAREVRAALLSLGYITVLNAGGCGDLPLLLGKGDIHGVNDAGSSARQLR
mmetsp:Transcript_30006/g.93956  ORF Transcript_30006/g.93956 Transcript_30006/m.93956 type:complete len:210 (+) Transcript_30006:50-679(+)